jgi:hypothetical protein
MHHFSLTCILEIGTVDNILFPKNAPDFLSGGAIIQEDRDNVVHIPVNILKQWRQRIREK